jgi:hypothetical protein
MTLNDSLSQKALATIIMTMMILSLYLRLADSIRPRSVHVSFID